MTDTKVSSVSFVAKISKMGENRIIWIPKSQHMVLEQEGLMEGKKEVLCKLVPISQLKNEFGKGEFNPCSTKKQ